LITRDNCAIDLIEITNTSGRNVVVDLSMQWGLLENGAATTSSWSFQCKGYDCYVRGSIRQKKKTQKIVPGETVSIAIFAAIDLSEEEATAILDHWIKRQNILEEHKKEFYSFFDGTPDFESANPALQKMWAYRWYLLKRNMADPQCGRLKHPLFYEGRSTKMVLTPWHPSVWEFSKLIPFGTPMHLLESRWHRQDDTCKGEILSLIENMTDDGLFQCVWVDHACDSYTDFVGWSVWQYYLVKRDRKWLAQVAPAIMRQVEATLAVFDEDHDFLPTVINHGSTGKEYQPSFFFKAGYPKEPMDQYATPLERVDAACYLYMNAYASGLMMRELGRTADSERMLKIAANVKAAITEKMWDHKRHFFYDIDAVSHDRIPVENVVGVDPFLADIAGLENIRTYERLADVDQLGTPCPVASTTRKNLVYSPDASWMGKYIKGKNGCLWNGAVWPFTNSTVLMGMANIIRRGAVSLIPLFENIFTKYTMMCFRNNDLKDPIIYEHYNAETGRPISVEEDYFHSTWLDLFISCVAGIIPTKNGKPRIQPVCNMGEFALRDVFVAGYMVDVESDKKGVRQQ